MSGAVYRLCRTADGKGLCGRGFALCRGGTGGGVEPEKEEYWVIDGSGKLWCEYPQYYGEGGRSPEVAGDDGSRWFIEFLGRNENKDMLYEISSYDDDFEMTGMWRISKSGGGPGVYTIYETVEVGATPSSIEFVSNMYEVVSDYEFEVETIVQTHLTKAGINENKPYLGLVWDGGLGDWVYDGHNGYYYETIIERDFVQHFRIPKSVMADKTAGGNKYQYNGHIAQQAGDYYTEDVGGSETEIWDNGCLLWDNGTYLIPVLGVGSPTLDLTATTVDVIYDDWASVDAGQYAILASDDRFPPDLRGSVVGLGGVDIREVLVDFTIGSFDYWVRKQE